MTQQEFQEAISMLRSNDSLTYEEGYHWLQGSNLTQHVTQIVQLLTQEQDPRIRGKYIELIGDADLVEYIPILVNELSSQNREQRFWSYSALLYSEHKIARDYAEQFKSQHPHEDFY